MNYNKHSFLEGKHALLGASKYHWMNDTEEELIDRVAHSYAAEIGTQLHDVARKHIQYNIKLKKYDKDSVILDLLDRGIPRFAINCIDINMVYSNLMNYVNDCIGFRMTPEVVLAYSDICFGTTDAIGYFEKQKSLNIFDLKTGTSQAHMEQLMIYVALFCLEYRIKPIDIVIECRIYQNNDIIICNPEAPDIIPIMDKIVTFDKSIRLARGDEVK